MVEDYQSSTLAKVVANPGRSSQTAENVTKPVKQVSPSSYLGQAIFGKAHLVSDDDSGSPSSPSSSSSSSSSSSDSSLSSTESD
ncbi:hypothetical protein K435DRAFT_773890, partial [Dendrothele bispora CBS 962.96]